MRWYAIVLLLAAKPTYELATAYMPPQFTAFFAWSPATGRVAPLSNGPGEQPLPVILATPDHSFAMGGWSPDPKPSYGRFRFPDTVKWNCVLRENDVAPGKWSNRCFAVVGTVDEGARALLQLSAKIGVRK
jgi:hypothetical protein